MKDTEEEMRTRIGLIPATLIAIILAGCAGAPTEAPAPEPEMEMEMEEVSK